MNVLPQLLLVRWSPWGINTIIKWILHPWVKKTRSIRIINKQNSPGYRHSGQRNSEPQQRKTIRVISQPFSIFRGPQLGPADLPSLGPVGLHFIAPPHKHTIRFPMEPQTERIYDFSKCILSRTGLTYGLSVLQCCLHRSYCPQNQSFLDSLVPSSNENFRDSLRT